MRDPFALLILVTVLCALIARAGTISKAPGQPSSFEDELRAEEAVKQEEKKKEAERIAFENSKKYFHEPASHEIGADDLLGHYDTRFFKGQLSYEDKRETQVHMIRAYLDTFRELGVETWIAHGTLLGWWWNGNMLPWDWDIDTQVSEATLFYLGEHLNNTRHTYTTASHDDHDEPITRTYLLDINPNAKERENGDGFNIIDARWINIHNGLYIDITGLSELEPQDKPGIVSCKNFHSYKLKDIYPLRNTTYEGVPAQVPYSYAKVLEEEYQADALIKTEFEGHEWVQSTKQWVKMPEKPKELEQPKKG